MNDRELFHNITKGNESAIALMELLSGVSQIWDDLIDQDKEVTNNDINQVFIALLSTLPRNRFYVEHFDELQPLIEMAIIDWLTANALENREDDHSLNLAWAFRSNLTMVLIGVAKMVGGMAHAIRSAPMIRQYAYSESLEEYKDVFRRQ
jgi:hypothetical protein